jgi:catechol 2,3-dioxygenase-like lactoylglutathione lyase family enzyme
MDGNLDEVVESLARADVPVELGPVARTGAMSALYSVYVRDPDGNLIELSQAVESKHDDSMTTTH